MPHSGCLPYHWTPYPHEPPAPTILFDYPYQASLSSMNLTFRNLNIPISVTKNWGPLQNYSVHGDPLRSAKNGSTAAREQIWSSKNCLTSFSFKATNNTVGPPIFACNVIPLGRLFLQRIIHLTRGVKKPDRHIKLNAVSFRDIEMWRMFIEQCYGVGLFLSSLWDTSDTISLYTDASVAQWVMGTIFQNLWL